MHIAAIILNWYKTNKRELPWRINPNPYHVWVSEIIMQQTRMEQGLPYFHRFIERFNNISSLANASEDDVLLAWQGLGYYSRARNMHFAAKYITNELNGEFPKTYNELLKLKGVGEYTAAAIASLCYNENIAAIDGNANRVIARIYDIHEPVNTGKGKKIIHHYANSIILNIDTNKFNQAIMDFGSMVCKPKKPDCHQCPLTNNCQSYINHTSQLLPIKNNKVKQRVRYLNYFVVKTETEIAVQKRTGNDIWKGLFEFLPFETDKPIEMQEILAHSLFNEIDLICNLKTYTAPAHILSHQKIKASFIELTVNTIPKSLQKHSFAINNLHTIAFPKLIDNYIINQLFK